MEPPSGAAAPEEPRAAATVLLLRDGAAGLEVFMVQRHPQSAVHGGVYVFPGGKVDAEDSRLHDGAHLDQEPLALWQALNEPELDLPSAVGLYVAAIRETFEECGVLLAHDRATGRLPQLSATAAHGLAFGPLLGALGLTLSTRALLPWSRWITPAASFIASRRFDTRFFVIAIPAGQDARHDDHEASDSVWVTPRAALESYWRGDIALAPPQIMSLAHLAHHADMASALAEAKSRAPCLIRPMPFEQDGIRAMAYPGDEQHVERVAVMPGLTRLILRNGRLEPLDGFEAFFG